MTFHLLHLRNYPILEQLQLEESLLRHDQRNWCVINEGSPRAIVMGISGKPEELVDLEKVRQDNIPLIKRFSGGGTVIVDEGTLFVSFICQKQLHPFPAFPEAIMRWSDALYKRAFDLFALKENDYVIGDRKCGGNAQYIRKERWLHHTSFLWDFDPKQMEYLLHPKKTPSYRAARTHNDFLCRLKEYLPNKEAFTQRLRGALSENYLLQQCSLEELRDLPHKML